jgi:FixJ family two-component response regulator
MNGLELQSHLAAVGCRIPIIFVSTYGNSESRRQAMQAGAVGFLDKPFTGEQLLQCVRSALRKFNGELGGQKI